MHKYCQTEEYSNIKTTGSSLVGGTDNDDPTAVT